MDKICFGQARRSVPVQLEDCTKPALVAVRLRLCAQRLSQVANVLLVVLVLLGITDSFVKIWTGGIQCAAVILAWIAGILLIYILCKALVSFLISMSFIVQDAKIQSDAALLVAAQATNANGKER